LLQAETKVREEADSLAVQLKWEHDEKEAAWQRAEGAVADAQVWQLPVAAAAAACRHPSHPASPSNLSMKHALLGWLVVFYMRAFAQWFISVCNVPPFCLQSWVDWTWAAAEHLREQLANDLAARELRQVLEDLLQQLTPQPPPSPSQEEEQAPPEHPPPSPLDTVTAQVSWQQCQLPDPTGWVAG